MESDIEKKVKKCCSREYGRLKERLDSCDSQSGTAADRHRCYRIAARSSGNRTRKCAFGG